MRETEEKVARKDSERKERKHVRRKVKSEVTSICVLYVRLIFCDRAYKRKCCARSNFRRDGGSSYYPSNIEDGIVNLRGAIPGKSRKVYNGREW